MLRPSINWLFAFIPVSLVLEHAHVPDPLLFFSAALAIVPIARLIVISTEQLATRTGDAVGGLLTATSGNAPELILALVEGVVVCGESCAGSCGPIVQSARRAARFSESFPRA